MKSFKQAPAGSPPEGVARKSAEILNVLKKSKDRGVRSLAETQPALALAVCVHSLHELAAEELSFDEFLGRAVQRATATAAVRLDAELIQTIRTTYDEFYAIGLVVAGGRKKRKPEDCYTNVKESVARHLAARFDDGPQNDGLYNTARETEPPWDLLRSLGDVGKLFTQPTQLLSTTIEDSVAYKESNIPVSSRIVNINNEKFFPVEIAAIRAQVREITMAKWLRSAITFNGKPIRSMQTLTHKRLHIAEESLLALETRFIKVPSGEAAGRVSLGTTDNDTGYISIGHAAEHLPISRFKLNRWAADGCGGPNKEIKLDVIRDPISEHYYIAEKSLATLSASLNVTAASRDTAPTPQSNPPSPRRPTPSARGRR
jgi:hypothetical protein